MRSAIQQVALQHSGRYGYRWVTHLPNLGQFKSIAFEGRHSMSVQQEISMLQEWLMKDGTLLQSKRDASGEPAAECDFENSENFNQWVNFTNWAN